nr:Flp pilus assembly protein CpaB [Roseovarius aestuariivivens]
MRAKPILTTLFGVAIAAGSVFVAKDFILSEARNANAAPDSEIVEIYVARSEIAFGQAIEGHLVTLHKWPREALPSGAFFDLANLVPNDREQLRRAKGRFFPGDVVLASKVSAFGEKVTLVQKLGENTRAMAIKVDAATAVGGFVTPGDFVDIVLTQGAQMELRAVTILQNIRVIGVDQQSEELKDTPEVARTITVEVTPEQGQRLALAQKAGTLNLTLRTLDGVEDNPMEMVRLRDLLQEEGPAEKVEKQPTIRVRRGTQSEIVTIPRSTLDIAPAVKPAMTQNPVQPGTPSVETERPSNSETDGGKPVHAAPEARDVDVTQVIGQ